MKLALGTVQFGLAYGVANQGGQVPAEEVGAIVRHAQSIGIDTLDTAIGYGESERRLGEVGVIGWQVISKVPAIPEGCPDVLQWMTASVHASLERLGVSTLYGLLLHKPDQLLSAAGPELYAALLSLRNQGLVRKIGVSIYAPPELDALCGPFQFDLVQAPFNLLDRRLIVSGWLSRLADAGIEVHARSVFLQGLLLMPDDRRPPWFDRWAPLWASLAGWLRESGQTPLEACLRDALSIKAISKVVVGVDSLGQLQGIVAAADGAAPVLPDALRTSDADLLNPARWSASA